MKFRVTKTSLCDDETPPCPGAYRGEYVEMDPRSAFRTFAEYDAEMGGWGCAPFLANGRNHRETDRGIVREITESGWLIEFAHLGQLMEFIGTHGRVVIKPANDPVELPELEIYDNYRE